MSIEKLNFILISTSVWASILITQINNLNATSIDQNITNVPSSECRIRYVDKYFSSVYSDIDYEHIELICKCNNGTITLHDPTDKVLARLNCKSPRTTEYQKLYILIHNQSAYGQYRMKKDGILLNQGFNLTFRFCPATSPKCRDNCVSKTERFCIKTKKHPGGQSCSRLSINNCDKLQRNSWFCPGDFLSYCEAAAAGLKNVYAQYTGKSCDVKGDSAYLRFGGNKVHYLETLLHNQEDNQFCVMCPGRCVFKNHTVKMKVTTSTHIYANMSRLNKKLSLACFMLPLEALVAYVPGKLMLHTELATSFDKDDDADDQRNGKASFRNYLVVFMQKIVLNRRIDCSNEQLSVEIVKSLNDQPEFDVNITVYLNDEQLQLVQNAVIVTKPGSLQINITQSYFYCAPHIQIVGPSLSITEEILETDLDISGSLQCQNKLKPLSVSDKSVTSGSKNESKVEALTSTTEPRSVSSDDGAMPLWLSVILVAISFHVLVVILFMAIWRMRQNDSLGKFRRWRKRKYGSGQEASLRESKKGSESGGYIDIGNSVISEPGTTLNSVIGKVKSPGAVTPKVLSKIPGIKSAKKSPGFNITVMGNFSKTMDNSTQASLNDTSSNKSKKISKKKGVRWTPSFSQKLEARNLLGTTTKAPLPKK